MTKPCHHIDYKSVSKLLNLKLFSQKCQFYHSKDGKEETVLWICINCLKTGCSRFSANECMAKHSTESGHFVCLEPVQGMVWCYRCDEELHEQMLQLNEKDCISERGKNLASILEKCDIFSASMRVKKKPTLPSTESNNTNLFGLDNLGNTCFFNSMFQIMLNSPSLIEVLREAYKVVGNGSMSQEILKLIDTKGQVKNPKKVFMKLISKRRSFGGYGQQDSHECLVTFIETLEDEFREARIPVSNLPFYSYLVYQCHCLNCQRNEWVFVENTNFMLDVNNTPESHPEVVNKLKFEHKKASEEGAIMNLNKENILGGKAILNSGFKEEGVEAWVDFTKKQNISETQETETTKLIEKYFEYRVHSRQHEGYQCESCLKNSTFGYNKHYIYKSPKILIICLKKFEKTSYGMRKLAHRATFPIEIDLSHHKLEIKGLKDSEAKYKLYGAVEHMGSLNSGHYVNYIKKENNKWFRISDSSVSSSSEKQVSLSDAYLLFYNRV